MLRLLFDVVLVDKTVRQVAAHFEHNELEQLIRDGKVATVNCNAIGTGRSTIVCDSALKPTGSATHVDEPLMPFGKHKGVSMSKVPVDYMHWLWHNGDGVRNEAVRQWIVEHWDDLKAKSPALQWHVRASDGHGPTSLVHRDHNQNDEGFPF